LNWSLLYMLRQLGWCWVSRSGFILGLSALAIACNTLFIVFCLFVLLVVLLGWGLRGSRCVWCRWDGSFCHIGLLLGCLVRGGSRLCCICICICRDSGG